MAVDPDLAARAVALRHRTVTGHDPSIFGVFP